MSAEGRLTLNSDTCPHCGADLVAGPIPEEERHMFGGLTHFKRLILHKTLDGSGDWIGCPDCGRKDAA